jgi:hypothetical protein
MYTYKPDIHAIMQSGNLYVYALNNPVMWIDPTGHVAARASSAVVSEGNRHTVTTTISAPLRGSVTVTWTILNGFVQLNFTTENFLGVLLRGGETALAAEMFHIARGIDGDFLSGRTIGGLRTDMVFHWAASETIARSQSEPFVMRAGGLNPNKPGADPSSVIFEGANAAGIAQRFVISKPWGTARLVSDISWRVFR